MPKLIGVHPGQDQQPAPLKPWGYQPAEVQIGIYAKPDRGLSEIALAIRATNADAPDQDQKPASLKPCGCQLADFQIGVYAKPHRGL